MAVSSRPDHFFQTSTSIAESERKQRKSSNTLGDPVKFPSKLLALQVNRFLDPTSDLVFLAEAGGILSSIRLSTNEIARAGKSVQVPLTCLTCFGSRATANQPVAAQVVFAGGWDKAITRFAFQEDVSTNTTVSDQSSFTAHSDFVKCLLVARTPDKEIVLLSGGAEGDIIIWTLSGEKLATIRPQCRGIECLALDPFSTPEAPSVFFSTSQREIFSFVLPASADLRSKQIKLSDPIVQHDTSVYKIVFDNDGDIWTASADKTSKRLVRENKFIADTTLAHPDFVRDVVVYAPNSLVVTACRDEEIRVWDSAASAVLYVFTGHFEEVTGLDISGDTLLSVSIDATLRRWSLKPSDLKKAIEEAKNPNLAAQEPEPELDLGMLTAEEEAELRAMMENEEQDALEKMAMDEQ